jgi:hypothetical protein
MKTIDNSKIEKLVPYLLSILFFIIYILTLSPTLSFIDSGELSAVCCTLGIAHPTGYPLFILVGNLFSKLSLFNSEIYTLNLMSALFGAIALIFFYKFCYIVFSEESTTKDNSSKTKKENLISRNNGFIIIIASIVSVISLALSNNYWSQVLSIEVYPLHILLISISLFLFVKAIKKPLIIKERIDKEAIKEWLIWAFVLGLCFTNHTSTIFLLPGYAFLFFYQYRFSKPVFASLAIMLIPFFVALSLYLYLPIRASMDPLLNWGNPSTLETFIRHISGKQYSVWMFSSINEMKGQMSYFMKTLPSNFMYLPIFLTLFGAINLFINNRKYFYFTIILFLTCFVVASTYSIVDIDSYFLLAYFIIALWVGSGVLWIYSMIKEKHKTNKILMGLFLIIPLVEIFNYSEADESNNYLVEDYTMNIFNSIEPNGIILSFQWDTWVSASYYLQHVKGIRKDIVVIDKELCRRSWYFPQLKNLYPWLIENSKKEIDEFLKELYKFEHQFPYDATYIENKFNIMLNSFIDNNISDRSVYLTNEIEQHIGEKYKRIPMGLVYKLNQKTEYLESPMEQIIFRPYNKKNKYSDMLMGFYGIMLTNRANYERYFYHRDRAYKYLDKLKTIYPDFTPALNLRRLMEAEKLEANQETNLIKE